VLVALGVALSSDTAVATAVGPPVIAVLAVELSPDSPHDQPAGPDVVRTAGGPLSPRPWLLKSRCLETMTPRCPSAASFTAAREARRPH